MRLPLPKNSQIEIERRCFWIKINLFGKIVTTLIHFNHEKKHRKVIIILVTSVEGLTLKQ